MALHTLRLHGHSRACSILATHNVASTEYQFRSCQPETHNSKLKVALSENPLTVTLNPETLNPKP